MRSLLRNKKIILRGNGLERGGLGIPRPDPPLNHQYKHKRVISTFDTGLWTHDRSQPEYTFSNPEQHMIDHWYTLRVWLKVAPYWIICTAGCGIVYFIFTGYRPDGYSFSAQNSGAIAHQEKRLAAKYIVNDHFLFPQLNGTESASQKIAYDINCNPNKLVSDMKADLSRKRNINLEGKNYAENLLKQANSKVDKMLKE